MNTPKTIPFGRISELLTHPLADRIAVHEGHQLFSDCTIKVYPSRKSLEAFLRNPGKWNAIVKNPVHPNALVYPAFQKAA